MEKKVLNYIEQNKMIRYGSNVVLGVSGGADSVCLLVMLRRLSNDMKLNLTAVHVNHHLRGQEADDDQKFVEQLCAQLDVPCRVYHIDMKALASQWHCSEEEAGRNARYDIFNKVASECGADYIAVAHNSNDNVETILFNLARGTGIKGLCGIRPVRDNIIRPIMCLSRKDIEKYLADNGYEYRTDSTNLTEEYSRNKIRNVVIPYLENNINSSVVSNIARIGEEMEEIEEILNERTNDIFNECVIITNSGDNSRCEILNKVTDYKPLFVRRVIRMTMNHVAGRLKDITRQHVDSVAELFENNTSAMVDLPYSMVGVRTYTGVTISIKAESQNVKMHFSEEILYEDGLPKNTEMISAHMVSHWTNGKIQQDLLYTKFIDCDKIKGNLVVRKRMPGDYIVLDGGNASASGTSGFITKKLKHYFIDEKLPKEERDDVILVADGSEIVWIVGHRLSAAYKVTDDTINVLEMRKKNGGSN